MLRPAQIAIASCVLALVAPSATAHALEASKTRAAADRIASAWPKRQLPDGRFRDYVDGAAPRSYGVTMLGYGLLRSGARRGDRALVEAGVRALEAARSLPASERGSFDLLAFASAYNFARRELVSDPAFQRVRASWEDHLRAYARPRTGPAAAECFADPSCFTNLKLVEAAGNLELLDSGLRSSVRGSKLSDRAQLRRDALDAVGRLAPQAIGKRASASGSGRAAGLGILSDGPSFPLAYHVLSTAMLARAVALLGGDAPAPARAVLRRATDTLAALTAPDGDVSYIGRSQQDSFAPAMAAFVGAATGETALAERGLERLLRGNGFGPSGINIAPRLGDPRARDYAGIDHYANTVVYNGLTLYALELAGDAAAARPAPRAGRLPADGDSHFLDPERTRFAAVRRGDVWYAVHERQQRPDLRDDFGLVAVKYREPDGRWRDVLRPRPLTATADSAGPILLRGRARALPYGDRMEVRRGGVVVVRGGFRIPDGPRIRRGVSFRYTPTERGVRVSFRARRGDRLLFRTFLPAGNAKRGERRSVSDDASTARLSPAPSRVSFERGFASCCDRRLVAGRMTLTASRAGRVTYAVEATSPQPKSDSDDEWVLPASIAAGAALVIALGFLVVRR